MLVVLTSHPIQYQAPLWRALAAELGKGPGVQGEGGEGDEPGGIPFGVWFLTDQGVRHTEDKDFGRAFAWDVDLLSGYPHRFLELRGQWDMRKFGGIRLTKPIGVSLREAGATAIWVEGWRFKPFWDAIAAAKSMGIPVFLRGETSDKIAEKGGLFGLARGLLLRRLFFKVDHFLAIGKASKRFYLKHGVPERKLIDAPYCVDNEFFREEAGKFRGLKDQETTRPKDRTAQDANVGKARLNTLTDGQRAIRKEWNIPFDAKVVMFCGKFVGKKRPMDVVLAAREHFDKWRDKQQSSQPWHLLFVGSGELGVELRAACDVVYDSEGQTGKVPALRNGGAPSASFVGFLNQSEIARAYAVADAVVLPSEAWETWGLVINEATAAGVPTVVSNLCGCSEDFASQNPYTRTFPAGNVKELAGAIEEVITMQAQPREVAKHADAFSPGATARAVAERLRSAPME